MKYRTRTGKQLGDSAFVSDVSKGLSSIGATKAPVISRLLSGMLGYFIANCAFLTKSFLRVKLGERTFGLFTLLFVYVIVFFLYLYPQAFQATSDEFFKDASDSSLGVKVATFFAAFIYIPFLVYQTSKNSGNVADASATPTHDASNAYHFNLSMPDELNYFILIILLIGIGHLIEVYLRRSRKEVIHSFYRGDSVFFSWLEGKQIDGFVLTISRIWMIVEPLFVLVVAFLIYRYLGSFSLAFVLAVSACCLFLEEYKVYIENRRFTLDLLDGRLDAAYMGSIQEEYRESLAHEKEKSAKSFTASLGGKNLRPEESVGSTSKFRAKVL